MELAFEYAILGSPVLLLPALLQRRWSRRLAMAGVAVLIGALTALFASINWGGPGDADMGRGLLVLYGSIASGLILIASAFMFVWSPPEPAGDGDAEIGS